MISFLFTTSNLPFSAITRWGLNTDCSHFAVGFDLNRASGIVFHSDFKGVRVQFYDDFKKHNRVIHRLEFTQSLSLLQEEAIYSAIVYNKLSKGYDYGAFAFWAINIIGNKLFNLDICKNNLWESKDSYLCTEVFSGLSGLRLGANITFPKISGSMIVPHELFGCLNSLPFLSEITSISS